jgi:hypothetical protein
MAWTPFKTAPTDGPLVIFWMSSEQGVEDITANFYDHARTWYGACDDRPLTRPDLVNGWMCDPQPPMKVSSPTLLKPLKKPRSR